MNYRETITKRKNFNIPNDCKLLSITTGTFKFDRNLCEGIKINTSKGSIELLKLDFSSLGMEKNNTVHIDSEKTIHTVTITKEKSEIGTQLCIDVVVGNEMYNYYLNNYTKNSDYAIIEKVFDHNMAYII